MLFRNPTHTQAYAVPSIQYAQPTLVASAEQTAPAQHLTAPQPLDGAQHLAPPQPTLAATFVNPTLDGTAVLPAPESTANPSATFQYAIPQLQYAPQQLHLHPVAPQSLHLQPEFIAPPQVHNPHQYYASSHLPSPVDIYHSLQKHHPTSLLDSYIPSSLIWAQRQRNAALINRQLLHAVSGNFASPTLAHPTQFFQQGSHQPGYNTIAYSTAQGYSKRSPKLVTERPLKLKPRN